MITFTLISVDFLQNTICIITPRTYCSLTVLSSCWEAALDNVLQPKTSVHVWWKSQPLFKKALINSTSPWYQEAKMCPWNIIRAGVCNVGTLDSMLQLYEVTSVSMVASVGCMLPSNFGLRARAGLEGKLEAVHCQHLAWPSYGWIACLFSIHFHRLGTRPAPNSWLQQKKYSSRIAKRKTSWKDCFPWCYYFMLTCRNVTFFLLSPQIYKWMDLSRGGISKCMQITLKEGIQIYPVFRYRSGSAPF